MMAGSIMGYKSMIIVAAVLVLSIGYSIYTFSKMPSEKQLDKVREWLIYAVTVAEKELGAGTGKLKLRYVYDMFVRRFGWIAEVITFGMFSEMVDEALGSMKEMLNDNGAIKKLVTGEEKGEEV